MLASMSIWGYRGRREVVQAHPSIAEGSVHESKKETGFSCEISQAPLFTITIVPSNSCRGTISRGP
jgi:hypothetical protein